MASLVLKHAVTVLEEINLVTRRMDSVTKGAP